MHKQYHQYYKTINNKTILKVRETIKLGLFKKDKSIEDKQQLIINLNKQLCEIYNLQLNEVTFVTGLYNIGTYNTVTNHIRLNKPSLVTYLHEFGHYLINKSKIDYNEDDIEESVIAFSHSIYYLATPNLFRNRKSVV